MPEKERERERENMLTNNFLKCDHPPDVCASDTTTQGIDGDEDGTMMIMDKERNLITSESTRFRIKNGTGDCNDYMHYYIQRDQHVIIAIIVLVGLLNFQEGRYILYPFTIFSTWVHELCHGITAVLLGGQIVSLHIYKDGSGLAYTTSTGENWKRVCIASAGYLGTATLGSIMLLIRRTRLGPTIGLISIGVGILISCILVVRNQFGLLSLPFIGIFLILAGWKLKAKYVRYLYAFLSVTCSLNALTSIKELFQPGVGYVNGEERYSDAHTVADIAGGTYMLYAIIWLIYAIITCCLGIVFAKDKHYS